MIPAATSAVRERSTACRIVSIHDSVSTSSFFAASGARRLRMNCSGVRCGKPQRHELDDQHDQQEPHADRRDVGERRQRVPRAPAAISAGERPTIPIHTRPMKSASGATIAGRSHERGAHAMPMSRLRRTLRTAPATARRRRCRRHDMRPDRPERQTGPLRSASSGFRRRRRRRAPQQRDEAGGRRAIEQSGEQDLEGLVERLGGEPRQHHRAQHLLTGLEEQRDEEGRAAAGDAAEQVGDDRAETTAATRPVTMP